MLTSQEHLSREACRSGLAPCIKRKTVRQWQTFKRKRGHWIWRPYLLQSMYSEMAKELCVLHLTVRSPMRSGIILVGSTLATFSMQWHINRGPITTLAIALRSYMDWQHWFEGLQYEPARKSKQWDNLSDMILHESKFNWAIACPETTSIRNPTIRTIDSALIEQGHFSSSIMGASEDGAVCIQWRWWRDYIAIFSWLHCMQLSWTICW